MVFKLTKAISINQIVKDLNRSKSSVSDKIGRFRKIKYKMKRPVEIKEGMTDEQINEVLGNTPVPETEDAGGWLRRLSIDEIFDLETTMGLEDSTKPYGRVCAEALRNTVETYRRAR